jgi:hypothetical protein
LHGAESAVLVRLLSPSVDQLEIILSILNFGQNLYLNSKRNNSQRKYNLLDNYGHPITRQARFDLTSKRRCSQTTMSWYG